MGGAEFWTGLTRLTGFFGEWATGLEVYRRPSCGQVPDEGRGQGDWREWHQDKRLIGGFYFQRLMKRSICSETLEVIR
jgi:hypothetical protein